MRENIEKDRENRQSVISMDNDRKDLAWDEIKTEHIVKDEWIDFRKSAYRFPDGSVFEPFYSYSRRNYVVIVDSDAEGKFICVRQFRQGIKEVTTELEFLNVELHSEGEIEDLIAKGSFQQCVHITAWLLSRRKKAV